MSGHLRRPRGNWVLVAFWLGSLALIRSGSVEERDPYWQIRAGLETLHGAPLTRPDSWSWAPVDANFSQTSPAWNMILALAWRGAGYLGLFLISVLTTGAMLYLLVVLARRLGAGPLSTLVGLSVTLLLALSFLSPRATVAAQVLFLGTIVLADWWRYRAARYTLPVSALVVFGGATMVAWSGSWLHLSWLLLAPAMAMSTTVLWAATPELGTRRVVVFTIGGTAGAAIGVLAGPYGSGAWHLSRVVQRACSGVVTEWLGMFTPGLAGRWALPGTLAIVTAAAAVMWIFRRWHTRGSDRRVGLLAALTILALPASLCGISAVRFIGISMLTLSPVAAMFVGYVAVRMRRRLAAEPKGAFRHERVRFWAQGCHWRPVFVALLVVLSPGVVLATMPLGKPSADVAIAETLPRSCRLFSDPGSAAAVVLLRPDVKVWIDGRADYYGWERNSEAVRLLTADNTTSPVLTRATCVVLSRDAHVHVEPLVAALDKDPAWKRLLSDGPLVAWARS
jgi:hypothetical protein